MKFYDIMLFGVTALALLLAGFALGLKYAGPEKHPTYHCDGSTTMGYAVPGTPEAAACWIEGGEK